VTLLALFDRMQAEGLPPDQKALTLAILAADQVCTLPHGHRAWVGS
jgi:hypothetical protein